MTRIWTGTAAVVSGYTTVVLAGDPLTAANCPVDATIVLAGATYFVAEADYPTMTVELTRAYEGTDGTVSAEIDPMTPLTGSVVALARSISDYDARLALIEAYGKGLFYTVLGVTGANDPGPGKIARNAATWAGTTALYLDVLDAGGFAASPLIDLWAEDTIVTIRSIATRGYAAFRLVATPTVLSGWRTLASLVYVGGDGALADGEDVAIEWNRIAPSEGLDTDATVSGLADLVTYGGQASGFRVLVNDTGAGRAAVYTLDASGSPEEWVGPAYVTGPVGEGLHYDAHVATIAAREAFEVESPGYVVLVDDAGDGRAALFTLLEAGSPSTWAGPAHVTGPEGDPGAPGASGVGGSTGSTDEAVLVADGAGGTTLKATPVVIDSATGNASGIGTLAAGAITATVAAAGASAVNAICTDAGASTGPWITAFRDSPSPAASDYLGVLAFQGRNASAATKLYGYLLGQIIDPTAGSEDGSFECWTVVAGADAKQFAVRDGIQLGAASGGFKGVGTLNATALHVNGIPWYSGSGSPEGVVAAPVGALYSRTDGGASTTLYVKTSGTGNTGWTAK